MCYYSTYVAVQKPPRQERDHEAGLKQQANSKQASTAPSKDDPRRVPPNAVNLSASPPTFLTIPEQAGQTPSFPAN